VGAAMSNDEISMSDKRRVLRDTLHSRTDIDDRGGRYAAMGKPVITGASPGPQYPRLPGGPWSQSIDEVSAPEPLVDGSDCGDTCIGEPLGGAEIEATSAQSPYEAQTNASVPHAGVAPPALRPLARVGGAPSFRRRI
jgi:hypothetical protein